MGIIYRALSIFILILSSSVVFARQEVAELKNNVVVTRDLSLSGERLCHDGRYIYYRTLSDCVEDKQMVTCAERRIAPLYQVERIRLSTDLYITQFYKIDLNYKYRTAFINIKGQPHRISESLKVVGVCKDQPFFRHKKNIVTERWAIEEEIPFLYVLLKNDISVINTPLGEIRSLKAVNLENHDSESLSIFSKINLKSPNCDKNPILTEYVMMLGGEYSGNGWHKANMEYLESSSAELKFKGPIENMDDLDKILKSSLYCVKTVDI